MVHKCKKCKRKIDESEMDRYEVIDTSENKKVFDLCAECVEQSVEEWD